MGKKFLIQQIVNGKIRNGYEFDTTLHTWILLLKICRCTTKTLDLFKIQLSSSCVIVLSCYSTGVAHIHEVYCSVGSN